MEYSSQYQQRLTPTGPNATEHNSYPPSDNLVYGLPSASQQSNASPPSPLDMDSQSNPDQKNSQSNGDQPKMESKPQATFLTKLYALLERPEYQSMIRWDPTGEQIIVERPEQLALHVLPSIYRQSRFASFSRQLNIYGFMRKVNLRNVDPAIDDPDASTWSHPTLNRHSPPEVVANFKRRVPPRLPKQRKRSDAGGPDGPQHPHHHQLPRLDIPPHHHSQLPGGIGLPTLPMTIANDLGMKNGSARPRGLSAPGPYGMAPHSTMTPISTPQSATFPSSNSKWGQQSSPYGRALPPISIPSNNGNPHSASSGSSYSTPYSHNLSGVSPEDGYGGHYGGGSNIPGLRDSSVFAYNSYGGPGEHHGSAQQQPGWSSYGLPPASSLVSGGSSPSHNGSSLSSILNPSSSYQQPQRPSLNTNTSFGSSYDPTSLSPGSRPTTGTYSAYDLESAPDSSRPLTPQSASMRPSSAKSLGGNPGNMSLRHGRPRRRSEALGPYPPPYYDELRPVTAPESLKLPSVGDGYNLPPAGEFAYSPAEEQQQGGWNRSLRPSTSTSSISAASTSMIHTPPIMEDQEGEHDSHSGGGDVSRYSASHNFFPSMRHPGSDGSASSEFEKLLVPQEFNTTATGGVDPFREVSL